jgi:hypothetical protein
VNPEKVFKVFAGSLIVPVLAVPAALCGSRTLFRVS